MPCSLGTNATVTLSSPPSPPPPPPGFCWVQPARASTPAVATARTVVMLLRRILAPSSTPVWSGGRLVGGVVDGQPDDPDAALGEPGERVGIGAVVGEQAGDALGGHEAVQREPADLGRVEQAVDLAAGRGEPPFHGRLLDRELHQAVVAGQ